jgi:hypothetical protein
VDSLAGVPRLLPRTGDAIDEPSLEACSASTVAGVDGSLEGVPLVEVDPIVAEELTQAQREDWPRRLRDGGWTERTHSWTRSRRRPDSGGPPPL